MEFFEEGSIASIGKGKLLIGIGPRSCYSVAPTDNYSFYHPDFFLKKERPWHQHEKQMVVNSKEVKEIILKEGVDEFESIVWNSLDNSFFENEFLEIQELIQAKKLIKAVPFVFRTGAGQVSHASLRHSLLSMLKYAQTMPVHLYGTWKGDSGILGATPEVLFQLEQENGRHIVHTVACAGTSLPGDLPDEKLCEEHDIVVQGIVEELKLLGEVFEGNRNNLSLGAFTHLLTPIRAMLHDPPIFEQIVRTLHPTPALGAYPREEGRRWLERFEAVLPRGYFGAPFGYADGKGGGAAYVAIRNMQWSGGAVRIGAGCGVVAASEKEAEWQEVLLKLKATQDLLDLPMNGWLSMSCANLQQQEEEKFAYAPDRAMPPS